MKPVATKDLLKESRQDDFSQAVAEVQQDAVSMERKTFTLRRKNVAYINGIAAKLTADRNKPVNASEALRDILDRSEG